MRTLNTTLASLLLLLLGVAVAQSSTPAGTEITNQASATFNDSAGQAQTTTSNQVVTIVQQVYNLSLSPLDTSESSPGQVKRGLRGAEVYFNYQLTNNGNGPDSFNFSTSLGTSDDYELSGRTSYTDANCNGTLDPGEGNASGVMLDAGATACILLEAEIPGDATDADDDAIVTGSVQLTATSAGDETKSQTSWSSAIAEEFASFDFRLSRTPSGTVTDGTSITYTYTGSNTGGAGAHGVDVDGALGSTFDPDLTGVLVLADVPVDTYYVHDSLAATAGAGDPVEYLYFVSDGSGGGEWTTTQPDADFPDSGATEAGEGFFRRTASLEMEFDVLVEGTHAPDAADPIEGSGTLHYAVGTESTDGREVESNEVFNPQANTYAVDLDPATANNESFMGWAVSSVSESAQTIAEAHTGDTVYFALEVVNDGTTTDSFALSLPSNLPVGWTCGLRQIDGSTPLTGNVGPLLADGQEAFEFSLVCRIAPDSTAASGSVEVTATSTADEDVSSAVTNIVTAVTSGYDVDLTSKGEGDGSDAGPDDGVFTTLEVTSDDATAAAISVRSGESFGIPLEVTNDGEQSDVFELAATNMPSGWNVTFHHDRDDDQLPDNEPTRQSDVVASTGIARFVAVVSVPTTQAPKDSVSLTFQATSTSDSSKTDTLAGTVDVTAGRGVHLTSDRAGTVTTPGTITYTLDLRNPWSETASVNLTMSSGYFGWTYQISVDDGSTWHSTLSSVSVPALDLTNDTHGREEVLVRVVVPAGQPIGRVDTVTVTATTVGATVNETVNVTTTVVGGDLVLDKMVDKDDAAPDEELTYTVTATNIGSAPISEVVIMEPLPRFTEFVSISGSTTLSGAQIVFAQELAGDQTVWTSSAAGWGSSLSAGQPIYIGLQTDDSDDDSDDDDDDVTVLVNENDRLPASGRFTITFIVRVK